MTGTDSASSLYEAIGQLKSDGFVHAHLGVFDLNGTFRERRLALDDVLADFSAGGSFVDVLPQWDIGERVFGSGPFVGEEIAVDPLSARPYPFEEQSVALVADYVGPSAEICPRPLLRRQIEAAAARGFGIRTGFEFEFFVLEEDARSLRDKRYDDLVPYARENRCWAGESAAIHGEFVAALDQTLGGADIPLYSLGLELGAGCFEATLRARDPLRAADDAAFFKAFTKAFCRRRGLTAAFMAQLSENLAGLSGHLHLSLFDLQSGRDLFPDEADGEGISDTFRRFAAGVLALAPEAMALSHHTVNAYRRHAPGNWAPKRINWAPQNYSAALRVVSRPADRCRLEYRLPGADTNPYLTMAFVIAAGLSGIDRQLSLPAPFLGGSPDAAGAEGVQLPRDLGEAAERLQASTTARDLFGVRFVDHFATLCRHEHDALQRSVSAAERARYIEVV